MVNNSRRKGTAGESDLVGWWRGLGYYDVDRNALHGANDIGDIHGVPGVEVISMKVVGRGNPMDLSGWLNELEGMKANWARRMPGRNDPVGLLVVRRLQYPNPGDWYAVQRLTDWWHGR